MTDCPYRDPSYVYPPMPGGPADKETAMAAVPPMTTQNTPGLTPQPAQPAQPAKPATPTPPSPAPKK